MCLANFYNRYHKKNKAYNKVISLNNFTYFYLLKLLNSSQVVSKKSFLDVGCGVGAISLYLASQGKEVVGIDVSSRAIDIANQAKEANKFSNVRFVLNSAEKFVPGRKFEVILLIEVIEHIKDDEGLLEKIFSWLKEEGYLVLTTPSSENIMFKLGLYKEFDKKVGHLRRYTKKEIIELLEKNGFEIVYYSARESLLRSILFTTRLSFLIKFIKGPLVPLFHRLDETIGRAFGFTDHIILAKKRRKE